jgi:hypothetical protein
VTNEEMNSIVIEAENCTITYADIKLISLRNNPKNEYLKKEALSLLQKKKKRIMRDMRAK